MSTVKYCFNKLANYKILSFIYCLLIKNGFTLRFWDQLLDMEATEEGLESVNEGVNWLQRWLLANGMSPRVFLGGLFHILDTRPDHVINEKRRT